MADNLPEGFSFEAPKRKAAEKSGLPEGFSFEPPVSGSEDTRLALKSGLANTVAGIPGQVGDVGGMLFGNQYHMLLDFLGPKVGLSKDEIEKMKGETPPGAQDIKRMTGLDKYDYDPQYLTGKGVKNVTEFAGPALTGPLGGAGVIGKAKALLGNLAKFSFAPGAATTVADEVAPGNPYVRAGAALVAPGAAHVAMSPGHVVNTLKGTPSTLADYLEHVSNLKNSGFKNFTPGEATNAPAFRAADEALLPNRYNENRQAITSQATGQVTRGEDGGTFRTTTIKPTKGEKLGTVDEMMGNIKDRFGRNAYDADQATNQGLGSVTEKVRQNPEYYGPDTVGAVNKYADRIKNEFGGVGIGGQMSGEKYHALLSDIRNERLAASNPKAAAALQEIEDQLMASARRSVERRAPMSLRQHDQLETDFKNALAIKRAAGGANHISPGNLEAEAAAVNGGRSNPYDWASSAKHVFSTEKPLATAGDKLGRLNEKLGMAIGAGSGAATGLINPLAAGPGGIVGAAIGHAVGPMVLKPAEKALYKAGSGPLGSEQWRYQARPYTSPQGLLTQATSAEKSPVPDPVEELAGLLSQKKRKLVPMPNTLD